MIRYYVIRSGEQFEVRREGRLKRIHPIEARAVHTAKFMASVEAAKLGANTQVILESRPGCFDLLQCFAPGADLVSPISG
ncbi:hypothetical protein [Pseudomarimonas arenosa]|uniref:Uncharacterized protein n=1 Tax=Pseudomarimonas arenosa TaxID=2774145 RepID=A0AAW3ZV13_9GAMM|nr:hypothetical protein [Pseudomarimonas arenosa]MBD8528157.1 hypothetical protein [Pseudomarimonas arenosa]